MENKEIEEVNELNLLIINQLYQAVENLGGKSDILATIGSYKDTMSDQEVFDMLLSYNDSFVKKEGKLTGIPTDTYNRILESFTCSLKEKLSGEAQEIDDVLNQFLIKESYGK